MTVKSGLLAKLMDAPGYIELRLEQWPLGFCLDLPGGADIVVAGAYDGVVMELLATLYPEYGSIHGFEPCPEPRAIAETRLRDKPSVFLHPYGLGCEAAALPMCEPGTAFASFYKQPKKPLSKTTYLLEDVVRVFDRLGLRTVDLLLLNMEGYEWGLIPYMASMGLLDQRVKRLVVQFHEDLGEPYSFEHITQRVEHTHKRVYDDYPRWVYWQRRATNA